MTSTETEKAVNFRPTGNAGLMLGILGMIGACALIFGGGADAKTMLHSYLFGWSLFLALALGCLGVTLLHHVTRGSWSLSILRLCEAGGGAGAFTLLAIAFLPIIAKMDVVYKKWMKFDPADTIIANKEAWLNQNAFILRFALYFLFWIGIAYFMRRSSVRQDESQDINEQHRRTNWGAPGLVLYVVSITLASTDFFMSLDPHWFSTMFGPLYMIVGANMAIALMTAVVCFNAAKAPYNTIMSKDVSRDLGNLTFAFTMLWIYFTLSQFIIIWSGNLPEFISFYDKRQHSSQFLLFLGSANVILGWFIPWMTLLAPRTKANFRLLGIVAISIFFLRFIDIYWNIMPFMRGGEVLPTYTDLVALVAIGGLWLGAFGLASAKAKLIPAHDTRLEEALSHVHAH